MRAIRFLIAAALGVATMGGPAQAADPAGTWLPDLKKTMYTDLISGWYVRGDAGFRWNSIGSVDSPVAVGRWEFDNAWTIGAGGGYKYHWFRADVTVDYAQRSEFYGDAAAPANYISTKIDAVTVLGNVYLDLGTWGGFTPYIGAGFGGSYLRTAQYTTSTWQQMDDGRGWNMSWAAMAGLSYRFTHNLAVDVGYRYLSLGEAHTGPLPPGSFTRVTFRDMTAQEVRIGLRLMLD
jgi:opacity protein-like surface antigen